MLIALWYELRILKLECDDIQGSMGITEKKTHFFAVKPSGLTHLVLRGMSSQCGAAEFPDFMLSRLTLYTQLGNRRPNPTTKFILESGFKC